MPFSQRKLGEPDSPKHVKGRDLGSLLAKAMGIPLKSLVSISVTARCDEAATVTLEYLVPQEQSDRLISILKTYRLVEMEEK